MTNITHALSFTPSGGAAATVDVVIPADVQVGHRMLIAVGWGQNSTTITMNHGGRVWDEEAAMSPSTQMTAKAWRRTVQAGDAGTTVTFTSSLGSGRVYAGLVVVGPADTTMQAAAVANQSTNANALPTAAIDPDFNSRVIVLGAISYINAATASSTQPSGWTELIDAAVTHATGRSMGTYAMSFDTVTDALVAANTITPSPNAQSILWTFAVPEAQAVTSKSASDSGGVSVGESTSFTVTVQASDTAPLSATDNSQLIVTVSSADSGAVGLSDTASATLNTSGNDTSAITIADTSSTRKTLVDTDSSGSTDSGRRASHTEIATEDSGARDSKQVQLQSTLTNKSTGDSVEIGLSDVASIAKTLPVTINNSAGTTDRGRITALGQVVVEDSGVSDSMTVNFMAATAYKTAEDLLVLVSMESDNIHVGDSITNSSGATDTGRREAVGANATDDSGCTSSLTYSLTNINRIARTIDSDSGASDTDGQTIYDEQILDDNAGAADSETPTVTSIIQSKSASDTSGIAVSESRTIQTISPGGDLLSVQISESTAIHKTVFISVGDSSAVSVAESRGIGSELSRTDTSSIAVSDTSRTFKELQAEDSADISVADEYKNTVQFSNSDASAVAVVDASEMFQAKAATDTPSIYVRDFQGTVSIVESDDILPLSLSESTSTFFQKLSVDTSSLVITEQASIESSSFIDLSATDSFALSAIDESVIREYRGAEPGTPISFDSSYSYDILIDKGGTVDVFVGSGRDTDISIT